MIRTKSYFVLIFYCFFLPKDKYPEIKQNETKETKNKTIVNHLKQKFLGRNCLLLFGKKKTMMVNPWCDMFTSQTILLQTEFAGRCECFDSSKLNRTLIRNS